MREKTIYVADDGKEFRDKKMCEMYDAQCYYGMRFFKDGKEFNAYARTFFEAVEVIDFIVITDASIAQDFFDIVGDLFEVNFCPDKVADGEVYQVSQDEDGGIYFYNLKTILEQLDSYMMNLRDQYHEYREYCGIEEHICEW